MKTVLLTVRVIGMNLYRLEINGETICEVSADVPAWMPVRPRLNQKWLKGVINDALRRYFARREKLTEQEVVKA